MSDHIPDHVPEAVAVKNLATRELQIYTCSPREAVIAAYAQSLHDWNTWDYERYGMLVTEGKFTVTCIDFSAFKDKQSQQNRAMLDEYDQQVYAAMLLSRHKKERKSKRKNPRRATA